MQTIKVVLTQPFVRHPAGLVLELDAATGISGWDEDERIRDRQNFSDKRTYHLPDGGNGMAYALPLNMTAVCPPDVFESEDLCSGPCRITGANRITGEHVAPDSTLKYGVALTSLHERHAHGLQLPVNQWEDLPKFVRVHDRLREELVASWEWKQVTNGLVDCSALHPGFFQLEIEISSVSLYQIQFVKSFPLLVKFASNGRFTTQKTPY